MLSGNNELKSEKKDLKRMLKFSLKGYQLRILFDELGKTIRKYKLKKCDFKIYIFVLKF